MKVILTFLLFFSLPAYAADKESAYDRVMRTGTLKCGFYYWDKYYLKNENTGEIKGALADIMNSVGRLLDLKIEFVESNLGQQVADLKSGKIDAHCFDGPLVYTSVKFLNYSKPLAQVMMNPYVRADDDRFAKKADLNNKNVKFSAMDGDLSMTYARKEFPQAQISSVPSSASFSDLLIQVATHKADAIIIDTPTVLAYNKNNPKTKLKPVDFHHPLGVMPIVLSTDKNDFRLLFTLNQAIDVLQNTGVMADIWENYYAGSFLMPYRLDYELPKEEFPLQ